jgi:hypothetical protein
MRPTSFLALILTLMVAPMAAKAVTDSTYVGLNNGTGYVMDPDFVAKDIEQDNILGIKMVRMGLGGIGGYKPTDEFHWEKRDAVIDAYVKAGIRIMADLTPRYQVSHEADEQAWKDNWRRYIHEVMSHCKGRVSYYIIDNEPDKEKRPSMKTTPEQEVGLLSIAYQEAKSIDPSIMVESPPVNAPESPYLHGMMQAGVDKCCDFIGIHAYGSEIRDGRFEKPWLWEKELGFSKPISVSEYGTLPAWHPQGMDGDAWRARWLTQAYVQAKRFGFSQVLLYDLDGHGEGVKWAFVNSLDNSWTPLQPGYDTIKNGFVAQGLTNGDFEGTNDSDWGWQTYFSPDDQQAPQGVAFLNDGANAHAGKGYLSLTPGPENKDRIAVRRVVEKLTPGKEVTVSAWVKTSDGATGILRVMGYDTQNGTAEQLAKSSPGGDWQQLSVKVTPTQTWVVIELAATGSNGTASWDDVAVQ